MFPKKDIGKTKQNWATFLVLPPPHPSSQASPHGGQDIKNSFREPCAKVLPRPPKVSNKQHTKQKSWFCTQAQKIAARWRCRLPIKNLTPHYNSHFCVIVHRAILTVQNSLLVLCRQNSVICSLHTEYGSICVSCSNETYGRLIYSVRLWQVAILQSRKRNKTTQMPSDNRSFSAL